MYIITLGSATPPAAATDSRAPDTDLGGWVQAGQQGSRSSLTTRDTQQQADIAIPI